jgi:polyisoprenoid-binding protein YceI
VRRPSGKETSVLLRPLLAAAVLAALAVPALAAEYTVDPNHTQATFTVTHLTISRVSGKIPVVGGTVNLTDAGMPTAIDTTLSVKDIDTEQADRDKDLRSERWFETDKYPTMTFVSKSVTGTPQAMTIVGELTFHGVTKPATLSAKQLGKIIDPKGHTHFGFAATTTIDRREWGMNFASAPGGNLIAGYDVTIDLNVEVISK